MHERCMRKTTSSEEEYEEKEEGERKDKGKRERVNEETHELFCPAERSVGWIRGG